MNSKFSPMLLKDFDGRNPHGLLASEKLDGVRAVWTGKTLLSRTGNRIDVPAWFTAGLPDLVLDGELWAGRGNFQRVKGLAQSNGRDAEWQGITFQLFDSPGSEALEARLSRLADLTLPAHCERVAHVPCFGAGHLSGMFQLVKAAGGEGLVVRIPESPYRDNQRSMYWMKVKRNPALYFSSCAE